MSTKAPTATVALGVTALTAAYAGGWDTGFIGVGNADDVTWLLTLVKADAASIEFRVLVEDEEGSAGFIDLNADGTLEKQVLSGQIPDPVSVAVRFNIPSARRCKLQAKVTGGSGSPTMSASYLLGMSR